MRCLFGWCAGALVLSAAAGSAGADVTFGDGTFTPGSWGQERVGGGGGSFSTGTVMTDGNPGAYRRVTINAPAVPGATVWLMSRWGTTTATRYTVFERGPLAQLDFSLDYRGVSGAGTGQVLYPAFKQQQTVFVALAFGINTGQDNAWHTRLVTGLRASDFTPLLPSALVPDFTNPDGLPIRFGFVAGTITGDATAFTAIAHYDNFRVEAHNVPGPPALAVVLAAGVVGRRRSRGGVILG